MNLSFSEVTARLSYCPDSGEFRWKTARVGARVGTVAGTIGNGYRQVVLRGRTYGAHRIAWLLMTGVWPSEQVDHINRDRSDNRWNNLRIASNAQNAHNSGRRSDNTSGFKGVGWDGKRQLWRADIKLPGVRKHLGMFRDPAEAHMAYAAAVQQYRPVYGRAS